MYPFVIKKKKRKKQSRLEDYLAMKAWEERQERKRKKIEDEKKKKDEAHKMPTINLGWALIGLIALGPFTGTATIYLIFKLLRGIGESLGFK